MKACDRFIMFVYAIAALFGVVQSRAVNISNTWMLPEEGFPVFYRYFRDRISWYEADAVCQFHHANLVTADSSSQYDAIRAYLKELDITEKVWIGLSKPQDKPKFLWTDFRLLTGDGHWQDSLPASDGQSLCTVMDPTADFLWRALPCGGPEVAAFICELPIPSWALGPRGCLLTELPSLTVLYIPEQSALELTSDCGLDGTKRIACKGSADREEMLRELTCVISNEDLDDDKSTKTSTSDYGETSTWDDNAIVGQFTTSWTSNTINAEDEETPTRHRRETEDTLSPVSTKSSFKEMSATDISWRNTHQEKVVLTTQSVTTTTSDEQNTVTPVFNPETTERTNNVPNLPSHSPNNPRKPNVTVEFEENVKATIVTSTTAGHPDVTTVAPKVVQQSTQIVKAEKSKLDATEGTSISTTTGQEGSIEDYPSAINQGQLFSIIENGTMFDIIELNETDQEPQPIKTTMAPLSVSTKKFSHVMLTTSTKPTKKSFTKKPIQPTKKVEYTKEAALYKGLTTQTTTTKRTQSVDELEENLTKEFEMMPDIKDTSLKLNRTFRKEIPLTDDEHAELESGSQFGVPRILNFSITNALEPEDDNFQGDQPLGDRNSTEVESKEEITYPVVKNHTTSLVDIDVSKATHPLTPQPIDPRLFILNNYPSVHSNNHSESIASYKTPTIIAKEEYLPKSLLGEKPPSSSSQASIHVTASSVDRYSEHPFPSDEPKKVNRHRNLHPNKARKFYPYFFSRMLG